MAFCLPKHLVNSFLQKLKSGEINPDELSEMSSQQRNEFFSKFLGEDNASKVNALFESKLLLKNQQLGMINWAKKISGMKQDAKRDLISRINRMTDVLQPENKEDFLADLAKQRLKIGVSVEEASKITDLARIIEEKKANIPEDSPIGSKERIDYGTSLVLFKDYVGGLKAEAKKLSTKELLTNPVEIIVQTSGVMKSLLASMDNSFFGRQGMMTLFSEPKIWAKNFMKSWGDMGRELKGIDAIAPIKADIFSRPNALNGKYKDMKLDIGLESEEAFPSQLPEKIPFFGKLFKASESAYNGAALRIRADLADKFIDEAESMGVNIKEEGKSLGRMINAMTGRGHVNLTPGQAKAINAAVFSIKFVKSGFDVLTAHILDKEVSGFAKKKAAKNLARLVIIQAMIMGIAKFFDPESVELDPRSSNFGKIVIGKNREIKINHMAGMNALATLASRITPSLHNGEWGFWRKTNKGKFINSASGKYGVADPSELIADFIKGKSSPSVRLLLNAWEGRTFEGDKPTVINQLQEGITPIPVENLFDLAKTSAGADPILYSILTALDLLGVNISTKTIIRGFAKKIADNSYIIKEFKQLEETDNLPSFSDPSETSTRFQSLKEQIGKERFKQAMGYYESRLKTRVNREIRKGTYRKSSPETKKKRLEKVKRYVMDNTLDKFGYKKPQ